MKKRCLYCYLTLEAEEVDFHAVCSKKMFGTSIPPKLPYSEDRMEELAKQVIQTQTTVTGVQPKLSLHLASADEPNRPKRFTIVGMWGEYIKTTFATLSAYARSRRFDHAPGKYC